MDNTHKQFELVFVLILITTYTSTAFLLSSDQCMAPPPCTCSGNNDLRCDSKSLTEVPHLGSVTTNAYISTFYIYFQDNSIHSIPVNVFQNVSSVNASSIYIDFDYNMINNIDPMAFTGVENTTTDLLLRNNKLTSLPSALGNLSKLHSLYLEGNPIVLLDSSIMTHLSPTLMTLGFDMNHFNSSMWPNVLGKLYHLNTLVVRYFPLNHLPLNAFAGFESSLTSLTLSYSKLVRIPAAVCHLQNLQTLMFENNNELESNISIFEPCSHKLTRLTSLSLSNDNLYSFPDVIYTFPSLTFLNLNFNKIRFINSNEIPYNRSLTTLYMNSNLLTRIPFALNKLKHLNTLDIASNHITTVEDLDLVRLTNLNTLYIYGNPIEYIAPHAFSHNAQISTLHLTNTKLHLIPEAVRSLTHLTTLYFQNNNADCSCKMSYLKGWNTTTLSTLNGECANDQKSDGIKQFLLTGLPSCP